MRTILTLIIILFQLNVKAQDTSAYELQRAKINALLEERSSRFGQYEESLSTKTGIFGLQTKRDIKNSNEILRQIALNDNNIFRELKVLLEHKDLQMQEVKLVANNNTERNVNYRRTIKELQDLNQELRLDAEKSEKGSDFMVIALIIFIIANIFLVYLLTKGKINKSNQSKIRVKH